MARQSLIFPVCLGFSAYGLLLLAVPVAAQVPPTSQKSGSPLLKVLPSDTAFAIGIRDFTEFETDLQRLNDRVLPQAPLAPLVLSILRSSLETWQIRDGWDVSKPATLFVAGEPKGDGEPPLMIALPIGDMKAMTGNFGKTPEQMPPGKWIDTGLNNDDQWGFPDLRYAGIRGQYIILGTHLEAIQKTLDGQRLGDQLSSEERSLIGRHDLFLFVDRQNLMKQNKNDKTLENLLGWQERLELTDVDRALLTLNMAAEIRSSLVLSTSGERARKLLDEQIERYPAASLVGLPAGNLLAAYSISDTDQENKLSVGNWLAAIESSFLFGAGSERRLEPWLTPGALANLTDLLQVGWQRADGVRSALYQNEQAESNGLLSIITILDVDDPQQFVTDMTSLTPFLNATLNGDKDEAQLDQAVIAQLLKDLAHPDYRARQLASTKLSLLGAAVLPQLREASQSGKLEIRFRANAIIRRIEQSRAEMRQGALEKDLLSRIKPKLVYQANQETLSGHAVDHIRLQLQGAEADVVPQLRYLFGPDWNKLRLVKIDGRVVLMLGSQRERIEQALEHLQSSTAGLTREAQFGRRHRQEPGKKVGEVHAALATLDQLTRDPGEQGPGDVIEALTSTALSIEGDQVRLDLQMPYEDLRVLFKRLTGNQ